MISICRMQDLFEILGKIRDKLQEEYVPSSMLEALKLESCRFYTHTALDICKQKLQGSISRESLDRIKEIRKHFECIEEMEKSFVDDGEFVDFLEDLYSS